MAPILNSQQQPMIMMMQEASSLDELYEDEEPASIWVKEKDLIRPSTNLMILQTLEPGSYKVDYSRDIGCYCVKLNSVSDELYKFSDSIITSLSSEISQFWNKQDLYKQNKLIHKRGILLQGYPGTGKTSIISLLCADLIAKGGIVFKISDVRNLSIYIEFIQSGFRKIQPNTPIITIIEDLDGYSDIESEMLDFLDGKNNIDHHVVIATTNNSEEIPDSFLRPSRFDLILEIPIPCDDTKREYLKFKNLSEEDIEKIIPMSKNFSLADLKEFYISVYLLGYSYEDAFEKITSPKEKKKYTKFPQRKNSIAI